MDARCQISAMQQLKQFVDRDIHSLVIEGPEGCGKTFIAREFAKLMNVSDFLVVASKVSELKQTMDDCAYLQTPVVICVENLDTGVPAASYSLLKFLEEPLPSVYTIVTCRNIENIPDTIVSRCPVATVSSPNELDRKDYAMLRNSAAFTAVCKHPIWRCTRTFKDVDMVLGFNPDQLSYFEDLVNILRFKDTVSSLMWKLGHYADNSEAPVLLVIRYLVEISNDPHIKSAGMRCISELSKSRIASHAVLAKFIFECKYCE